MIEIDAQFTDLKRFGEQAKAMGARGTRFAINDVLNDLAFGAMRYYPRQIQKKMTVRNKRFVRGRFGVAKSRPRELRAYTFSRRKDNFTGWVEQQRGGNNRDHFGTRRSRGGNKHSGTMRMKMRMNQKFPHMSNMSGSNPDQQFAQLLRRLREDMNSRGPFIAGGVGRGGKMPWGLWTMDRLSKSYADHPEYRSLHLLQKFEDPADAKRMDWATDGAKAYLKEEDVKSKWMAAYARSWRKAKR